MLLSNKIDNTIWQVVVVAQPTADLLSVQCRYLFKKRGIVFFFMVVRILKY